MYSLLDAAALATTSPLDFSDEDAAPDFTCLSFYKIFGFPDLGGLIVRKAAGDILRHRRTFFGGTVEMVVAMGSPWHAKKTTSLHDRLEDGTLPFHSIFALDHAIDVHKELFGSMKQISAHTTYLAARLHDGLFSIRHYNGQPVCRIYNDDTAIYGDAKSQGATIALNILRSDGSAIGYADIEIFANKHNIFIRSGTLCNPGGFSSYLSWPAKDMRAAYDAGHRCNNPIQLVNGKPTGVVRVSLGAMSTISDVDTWLNFVRENYVEAGYKAVLPSHFQQLSLSDNHDTKQGLEGSVTEEQQQQEDSHLTKQAIGLPTSESSPPSCCFGRDRGSCEKVEAAKFTAPSPSASITLSDSNRTRDIDFNCSKSAVADDMRSVSSRQRIDALGTNEKAMKKKQAKGTLVTGTYPRP